MRRFINLKKGLNLNLAGGLTSASPQRVYRPEFVAVSPDDFPGFMPKMDVREGDSVCIGSPLMHHKTAPEVKIVSPAAGVVERIERGARRKVERVVVRVAAEQTSVTIDAVDTADAAAVRRVLQQSGLWAMMRQRPFDIVPEADSQPRDIFVTALDTAPLALELERSLEASAAKELEAGVKVLKTLTAGNIYIGVARGSKLPDLQGAETVEFPALHPAGNAGVQAANIAPVNKGETVWTLDVVTLAKIGRMVLEKTVDFTVNVAVTGPEVKTPEIVTTVAGAELKGMLADNLTHAGGEHLRIIAGNVLTGVPQSLGDGYLRYPYRQVTVIAEGDNADEFMGWASLSPSKMSESRTFFGKLLGKAFRPDARLNGGRRAMIMSGVYDKYLPMDVMPEFLLKAINAKDIDRMEALGIYEVAPEDFALAEYADPSKIELQQMVRQGLDYLRSEV